MIQQSVCSCSVYGSCKRQLYLLTSIFDQIDWNLVKFNAFESKSCSTQNYKVFFSLIKIKTKLS